MPRSTTIKRRFQHYKAFRLHFPKWRETGEKKSIININSYMALIMVIIRFIYFFVGFFLGFLLRRRSKRQNLCVRCARQNSKQILILVRSTNFISGKVCAKCMLKHCGKIYSIERAAKVEYLWYLMVMCVLIVSVHVHSVYDKIKTKKRI